MRVLITGATGQLGHDLLRLLETTKDYKVIATGRPDLDITDYAKVKGFISEARPDIIIHAAAFTSVDQCESQMDLAFKVNALGARNVASVSSHIGAKLVYISTDYVFDGAKEGPYREFDTPNPLNIYGQSKLLGEQFVKEQTSRFFIIRTAWLYGIEGRNFVKTMLELGMKGEELRVVNDQRGTPSCTTDLAREIIQIMTTELYGTYHCTSQGECTWYDFAVEIFRCANLEVKIRPVSTEDYPRPARRPKNSVLDNYMLRLQGLDTMPDWRDALSLFMRENNILERVFR
ncbi:MAG TPA: dTDP-4-dehydrorhamnose reductase [Thermodesulfobacteriota bacterium]|nr:dTDP-4-dehydrorhamnose reductase [Thermodesulfobacteriota bacterium]